MVEYFVTKPLSKQPLLTCQDFANYDSKHTLATIKETKWQRAREVGGLHIGVELVQVGGLGLPTTSCVGC